MSLAAVNNGNAESDLTRNWLACQLFYVSEASKGDLFSLMMFKGVLKENCIEVIAFQKACYFLVVCTICLHSCFADRFESWHSLIYDILIQYPVADWAW